MSERDDFPPRVVKELRERVGGLCSVPNCGAQTTGPSDSRASGISNVGVAAHITAAAPRGPRFDARLTAGQRQARENGIWVCQTHGKQIDDDERRFTSDLLRNWRDHAEERSAKLVGRPLVSAGVLPLVSHRVVLHSGEERQRTSEFLEDIVAAAAWGWRRSELVRMALYEIALNAATHGLATEVTLRSDPGSVILFYDGAKFGLNDLLAASPHGGGDAVRALESEIPWTLELDYRYNDGRNEWFVLDLDRADPKDDPCGVQLGYAASDISFNAVTNCDEIHVYAHDLWSFSDVHKLAMSVPSDLHEKPIVICGLPPGSPLVERLHELLPQARFADHEL
jgi:hypothetical protein